MEINSTWLIVEGLIVAAYLITPFVAAAAIITKHDETYRTTAVMNSFVRWWTRLFVLAHTVILCAVALLFGAYWLIVHVVVAAIVTLVIITTCKQADSEAEDDETEKVANTYIYGFCYLVIVILVGVLHMTISNIPKENARFTQPVSHYVDADDHKLEGNTHTYPISSLRISTDGNTYRWVERKEDGTLRTRKTPKLTTMPSEVIVKDDLPATDTEARVERRYEYLLDPTGIAAGHKECIFPGSGADVTLYNLCGHNDTVKFVRAETVIHVPQGSGEKMLPVVAE